ncbi:Putative acetyltransferase [Salmonella enterica subsp. enterica serovar Montevideo str. S5-403]|uniref:Putative acetyltransferase n=1 Tax=Salmonella enterica subsp. enterica serovar Montevideo str. S5-403 TaxID=913242 RepID=G5Q8Y9_SALMO|nr:Putative acetyltransferase [Salmonella enterica subsp. enterica serovar Montevideo str. S5-403]
MSEIVIRHAEPKDYDAIRQIHAQPEVYHNTLQVPHPSLEMWQARLTEQAGVKQLVACIDDIVVGHLSIQVTQRPRRSHVADPHPVGRNVTNLHNIPVIATYFPYIKTITT